MLMMMLLLMMMMTMTAGRHGRNHESGATKTTRVMRRNMFQERSRRIAEELKGRGKNCSGPAKETKTCRLEELQTLFWTFLDNLCAF